MEQQTMAFWRLLFSIVDDLTDFSIYICVILAWINLIFIIDNGLIQVVDSIHEHLDTPLRCLQSLGGILSWRRQSLEPVYHFIHEHRSLRQISSIDVLPPLQLQLSFLLFCEEFADFISPRGRILL